MPHLDIRILLIDVDRIYRQCGSRFAKYVVMFRFSGPLKTNQNIFFIDYNIVFDIHFVQYCVGEVIKSRCIDTWSRESRVQLPFFVCQSLATSQKNHYNTDDKVCRDNIPSFV